MHNFNLLWFTSYASMISSIHAYYKGYYDFHFLDGVVWLTSINYWRKPQNGIWRNLDIISVYYALGYHLYHARNAENAVLFYSIMSSSCILYPLSVYYINNKTISTYLHGGLHIGANVALNILYSGKVYTVEKFIQ